MQYLFILLIVLVAVWLNAWIIYLLLNKKVKIVAAFLVSWVVPGLGYWILERKSKGILLFTAIMCVTVAGIILADFRDVRFIDNPYYYIGRFGCGLIWGVITLFLHSIPRGFIPFEYFDTGHLFICVAGTLNLIITLSIFTQPRFPAGEPLGTDAAKNEVTII